MKNRYQHLFFIIMTFAACTVDEEPAAPTGKTNQTNPVFLSAELTPLAYDSVLATARLSSLGNLAILHHGWVWSEDSLPTVQDNKLESGPLGVNDSFEMRISGLAMGKKYYLRPYVLTGSGETYGPEKTVLIGIPKVDDLSVLIEGNCNFLLRCSIQNVLPLSEYGIVYLRGQGTPTLEKKDGKAPGASLKDGSFQLYLTQLAPNISYSLRAYAVTASGVGYSGVLTLTTPTSALQDAYFSINTDREIFQGAVVKFNNYSIGASSFSWDFGDGGTSSEESPVHIFNTLGAMSVRLTARQGVCALTKDTILQVIDNPFQDYWVEVPGGTFTMGCTPEHEKCDPDEKPAHQVTLNTFFIGKTEITQGQWLAVNGNNPSHFSQCGLDCPVETVSWNAIVDLFIPALNRKTGRTYSLPTEAEWEFAGRGGNNSLGYKYAGSNDLDAVAWWDSTANDATHPVGKKLPNELGLYDMTGNVWEWCQDWYDENYYPSSPSFNPVGPANGTNRVTRGGMWWGTRYVCRLPLRIGDLPNSANSSNGFRLVRR